MRKLRKIGVLIVLVILLGITRVDAAASYNVVLGGQNTAKAGDTVTMTISVKNLNEIGGTSNQIEGISGVLSYDTNVLTIEKDASGSIVVNGENGFDGLCGTKLEISSASGGASTDTEIATIKFTVNSNAPLGDTKINLTGIQASNGSNTVLTTGDVTKIITVQAATPVAPAPVQNTTPVAPAPVQNTTPAAIPYTGLSNIIYAGIAAAAVIGAVIGTMAYTTHRRIK